MARFNAMTENFEEVEILGKPALFSSLRIDRSTLPKGLYLYEVRHDDGCQGIACQIARGIMVNHWGTLITREPIKLPPDGYRDIEPEDLNYCTGDCSTVKEYVEKYLPIKAREKEHER